LRKNFQISAFQLNIRYTYIDAGADWAAWLPVRWAGWTGVQVGRHVK